MNNLVIWQPGQALIDGDPINGWEVIGRAPRDASVWRIPVMQEGIFSISGPVLDHIEMSYRILRQQKYRRVDDCGRMIETCVMIPEELDPQTVVPLINWVLSELPR